MNKNLFITHSHELLIAAVFLTTPLSAFAASPTMLPRDPGRVHIHYTIVVASPAIPANLANQAIATIRKQGKLNKSDNDEIDYLTLKKSTHIVHGTSDYWANGNGEFCWKSGSNTLTFDGKSIGSYTELAIKSPQEKGSNSGYLKIDPVGDRDAGIALEEVPLLGFMQPAKNYLQAFGTVITTSTSGTVEKYQCRHPYHANENVDCEMRFDSLGRFVKFSAQDDIYTFSDFQLQPNGVSIPKTVQLERKSTINIYGKDYPITINLITYRADSIDANMQPEALFGHNNVPKDTQVLDLRYQGAGYKSGVNFLFDGATTIDAASLKIVQQQSFRNTNVKQVSRLSTTVRIVCCLLMFLLLVHITRLLRTGSEKED